MKKVGFPAIGTGLEAQLSGHFGHANGFVVISYDETTNDIQNVEHVTNAPHQTGGCMMPVMTLKNTGADSVVVGGIGGRPLMGFMQVGIEVYGGIQGTVQDNFNAMISNKLEKVMQSTCSHGNQ